MGNQPLRGNPESKQVFVQSGFKYGMNITFSDDLLPLDSMRNLVNFDLGVVGELSVRKGFASNTTLNSVLFPSGAYCNSHINLNDHNQVFFSLLEDYKFAFKRLGDSKTYEQYIQDNGISTKIRYLALYIHKTTKDLYWEDITVTLGVTPTYQIDRGVISTADFVYSDNLFNWNYVDQYGRYYFTSNDKGVLIYDSQKVLAERWAFVGDGFPTNNAYKPSANEIANIGFNVLGTDPIGWVQSSDFILESIQAIFLTTTSRIPVYVIPQDESFQINIYYTGDVHNFEIELKEVDQPVDITYTKNTTLSVVGSLAVYDVTMLTRPADEVEIAVSFNDAVVILNPFRLYKSMGRVPADAKPITALNAGEFKLVEMYDRLVYYHGNVIWFSEVDVYDYIPEANYVLLPLASSDEIVRIAFFRDSYIVFTKNKIYKMTGDFESNVFSVILVNENIGCVAPDSVQVIQNEMYFVSAEGLRSLRTDTFKANLENIRDFEDPIYPLINKREYIYGINFDKQYWLFNNLKGQTKTIDFVGRTYEVPSVIRYYYNNNAFVTDIYTSEATPTFIFSDSGNLYSLKPNGIYRFGDGVNDFGVAYDAVLETIGYGFGVTNHEKKVKEIIVKGSGGDISVPINIMSIADGVVSDNNQFVPIGVEGNNIVYQNQDIILDEGMAVDNLLGVGSNATHTKKFRVSSRGNSIGIRLVCNANSQLKITSLGFIYKIGKIRE